MLSNLMLFHFLIWILLREEIKLRQLSNKIQIGGFTFKPNGENIIQWNNVVRSVNS